MKLSNSITFKFALTTTTVCSLALLSPSVVSAERLDLVSPQMTQQILDKVGQADSDELLVDSLTQVESQLRELGISDFRPSFADDREVLELKEKRRQYIAQLRQRLRQTSPESRAEFLTKIRQRRAQVRTKLVEVRRQHQQEIQAARERAQEARKAELEASQQRFKENMQARNQEIKDRQRPAEDKFKENLEQRQVKIQEKMNKPEEVRKMEMIEKKERQGAVRGAIDHQPETFFEQIGYWLLGR